MAMTDCIFCKIAAHEIPASIVYEDDKLIAFDDLYPQAPVHVLLIPKEHYQDIADSIPDDLLLAMMRAIPEIAKIKGIDETGYRVVTNKGADAGQTVFHVHIHIMGGKTLKEEGL